MKNKPRYDLRLTPEKTLELLTQISSGLLAGGHFREELYEGRDSDEAKLPMALAEAADDVLDALRMHVERLAGNPELNDQFILPDASPPP